MGTTLKDIAKIAGVSTTTVSHAINHTRYVNPEIVERIEKAISATGYKISHKLKSGIIALIVPSLNIPFFSELSEYLTLRCSEEGYSLMVLSSNYLKSIEQTHISDVMQNSSILGLLISPFALSMSEITKMINKKIPTIFLGQVTENDNGSVIYDNIEAFSKATEYLLKCGHERIVLILNQKDLFNVIMDKTNGYRLTLEKYSKSFDPDLVCYQEESNISINDYLSNLFLSNNPPTAVICGSTKDTFDVMYYINQEGIKCPDTLSIIGNCDSQLLNSIYPPLTVVSQLPELMGNAAMEMLAKMVENRISENIIKLPSKLIIRNSIKLITRGHFGEMASSPDVLDLTEAEVHQLQFSSFTAALSLHDMNSQLMKSYEMGIRDVFDKFNIKLNTIYDAHFDPVLQARQLEGLLMQEPNVIIALPADEEKTAESFREIVQSKSKLVLLDNVPYGIEQNEFVSCIAGNDRENGYIIARILGNYFKNKPNSKIGLLTHGAESFSTKQRDFAVEQALRDEFPEIEIVSKIEFFDQNRIYEILFKMMKEHPDINGLYVSWDVPACIVKRALVDLDRTDVVIATADLGLEAAISMAKGESIIGLGAQRPYEQGMAAAMAAANALIGKKVPSYISVHPFAVVPSNLKKAWREIVKSREPQEISDALQRKENQKS